MKIKIKDIIKKYLLKNGNKIAIKISEIIERLRQVTTRLSISIHFEFDMVILYLRFHQMFLLVHHQRIHLRWILPV